MRFSYSLIIVACLAGCTRNVYHDRQTTNPNYYAGRDMPVFRPQIPVNPLGQGPDADLSRAPGTSGQDTVVGLVASAITLASNPDYYRRSTIAGRCLYDTPEGGTLEIPCVNVTIALLDAKGHPVERYLTTDGTFAFFVERNKTYGLSVESKKYQMVPPQVGPVAMGDDVVIRLTPREPTSSRRSE